MAAPPPALVDSLVRGPSLVTGVEWHEEIDSTMRRAAELAREGSGEGRLVLADVQTAGRGRLGRPWSAPPGTSLLFSLLLRPAVARDRLPLLPLLVGVALAEAVAAHLPGVQVGLKWPNDLLVAGAKAAGVLVELGPADAAIVGVGLDVDWRGVARPRELAGATSLAEAAGRPVDRWRVLPGVVGVLGNRYRAWNADPQAFLPDYTARCATLGMRVEVAQPGGGSPLTGTAEAVTRHGALLVRARSGRLHEIRAGDVVHVRPGR